MPTTSPGCTVVGSRTSSVSSTMCGVAETGGRRGGEHEQPARRDDADAEGHVARVDEMDSHRDRGLQSCKTGGVYNTASDACAAALSGLLPRPLPAGCLDSLDARLRAASGVFLEFHPARGVSGHRRRLPDDPDPLPVRVVRPAPGPGDRGGRLLPARSGGADVDQHLLLERHHRAGGGRREHDAAAAGVRGGGGAVRHPGPDDGQAARGAAAAQGLRREPGRQRRRGRGVRADVVARAAADGVVRGRLRGRRAPRRRADGPGRPAGDDRPAGRIAGRRARAVAATPPGRRTTRSPPSRKGRRPSSRSTTSSTSRWPRWRARSTSTSGRTRPSATASRTC